MKIQYYIILSMILILSSCSDDGINLIYGCTNEDDSNYNPDANIDDDTCECFFSPPSFLCDEEDLELACYPYTYDDDIYDIFNENGCLVCHTGTSNGGLDLSHRSGLLNGGNNGYVISPCNPSESLLITTFNSGGLMCQNQDICNLPDQSIIETWISQGSY